MMDISHLKENDPMKTVKLTEGLGIKGLLSKKCIELHEIYSELLADETVYDKDYLPRHGEEIQKEIKSRLQFSQLMVAYAVKKNCDEESYKSITGRFTDDEYDALEFSENFSDMDSISSQQITDALDEKNTSVYRLFKEKITPMINAYQNLALKGWKDNKNIRKPIYTRLLTLYEDRLSKMQNEITAYITRSPTSFAKIFSKFEGEMAEVYAQVDRAIVLGDCYKSAEEYALATTWYKNASEKIEGIGHNQSYKKAQIYQKMAFCYEMLNNAELRNDCYRTAAENYEGIGYAEPARKCRQLLQLGLLKQLGTEDDIKNYVTKIERSQFADMPLLVRGTKIDINAVKPLKVGLLIRLLANIEQDDRDSCENIVVAIQRHFDTELSKNEKLNKELMYLMVGLPDMKKNKDEIKKLGISLCEGLIAEWGLGEVKELSKLIGLRKG